MSVYYYEPFFSLSDMSSALDDSPRQALGRQNNQVQRTGESGSRLFQPKMDIHENAEHNLVTATFELPGMKKDEVSIDIRNSRLVISGETKHAKEFEENGYVHRERSSGKFSRTLPLPAGAKPEEIKAKMENGVLTVTFPKTSAEQAPQKITIA